MGTCGSSARRRPTKSEPRRKRIWINPRRPRRQRARRRSNHVCGLTQHDITLEQSESWGVASSALRLVPHPGPVYLRCSDGALLYKLQHDVAITPDDIPRYWGCGPGVETMGIFVCALA